MYPNIELSKKTKKKQKKKLSKVQYFQLESFLNMTKWLQALYYNLSYMFFSVCADTFEEYTNTSARGGVLAQGIMTWKTCQNFCLNIISCRAVDWDTLTLKCFTHVEGYLSNVNPTAEGVIEYRRRSCETTPVVSTTVIQGRVQY